MANSNLEVQRFSKGLTKVLVLAEVLDDQSSRDSQGLECVAIGRVIVSLRQVWSNTIGIRLSKRD